MVVSWWIVVCLCCEGSCGVYVTFTKVEAKKRALNPNLSLIFIIITILVVFLHSL